MKTLLLTLALTLPAAAQTPMPVIAPTEPCQAPLTTQNHQTPYKNWRLNFSKLGIITPPNPLQ